MKRKELMKNMTAIWEKIQTARIAEMSEIATSMAERVKDLEASAEEAKAILQLLDDEIDSEAMEDLHISVSKYKGVYISEVKDKDTFEKIVILLTDRYNEGRKEPTWDNGVRYIWDTDPDTYSKNIQVTLSVSTTVTGCKVVKEKVYVPEKLIPAHEEEKSVVKCE